ncbi:hypothetical protein EV182_002982 [Spiromyces aspiralis]|uniref:Uncharacterized protein n=1 Tax=Spiromyces aspiralis TaxID=68401 RepID=A0ACC1HFT0_9FUNG|nr:hypothetical protein EV182_002982 [Spiromyces aspiralis]
MPAAGKKLISECRAETIKRACRAKIEWEYQSALEGAVRSPDRPGRRVADIARDAATKNADRAASSSGRRQPAGGQSKVMRPSSKDGVQIDGD